MENQETETTIQIIVLLNNLILITEIEEILVDFGEPNCRLINPCIINEDRSLSFWLKNYTSDREIMIGSDKIITLVEPTSEILEKYIKLTS